MAEAVDTAVLTTSTAEHALLQTIICAVLVHEL